MYISKAKLAARSQMIFLASQSGPLNVTIVGPSELYWALAHGFPLISNPAIKNEESLVCDRAYELF